MKKICIILAAALMVGGATNVKAADYNDQELLKLDVPEMKPELTYGQNRLQLDKTLPMNETQSWTWMKTNPGVKPFKVMDDLTFVGIPVFVAGWAIKGDKAMFRVNNKEGKKNTQLLTDFKTGIDDYSQYFGPAMTLGLKIGGVEGRSDWGRLLASAAMSYGIMAGFVNGIKYTAKEMRPDGSTANSWPSGHTATSFVGATLLHKEYGLTVSPWYSVAGYGVATATGVMRVLNNRHWVSDVLSGAGIGIMSTEIAYALSDVIFKGKGLLRNNLVLESENPSFFAISMGLGIGEKSIGFMGSDLQNKELYDPMYYADDSDPDMIEFRSATVVDAEGAYFFNKYIGVGGRLRVRAMSAKSFGDYSDIAGYMGDVAWASISDLYIPRDAEVGPDHPYYQSLGYNTSGEQNPALAPVTEIGGVVKSDHLAEFTGSVGLYFNLPISKRFSIGTKALIGRSITQELDIDGFAKGNVKDINYEITFRNGEVAQDASGKPMAKIDYPVNTGETYEDQWDFVTLGADNSTSYGTGLSLTYRYKSNFSWRLFCDYDYTEKTFTLKYDPFHFLQKGLTSSAMALVQVGSETSSLLFPMEYKHKKKMNYVTIGASFSVAF
jgi:membrane-associated phospholipid phosphatase